MKKLALILITTAIVACSSNATKDEETVRERAKKDIIEKLQLPEGTTFNDESIEVATKPENAEGPEVVYIVKVTVKSEDQSGNEIVKIHTMQYKKREDAKAAKDRFELISFE